MEFTATIRKHGSSLAVVIPHELVTQMKLKAGEIKQFGVSDDKHK